LAVPSIALVVARARNGVIGRDGDLPWRLRSDLQRFKAVTVGKPCIMGRKTWDSLPERFRPLPGRTNIVVTRTFSKLHGLGGLRVGFGYAPLAVEQAIDRIRLPFNVSVPGIEAAIAALGDEAHQKASRDLVAEWRPRLIQAVRGFGFEVLPASGNFILIRFPDAKRPASAAQDYLQSQGIIVRGVASYGLPDCLRVTVGTADQNRAVLDALSEFAAR